MRKRLILTMIILFVTFLTGCATYPIPITATGNDLGYKIGMASGHIYFGMFGDASDANIPAAARNGNIIKISTVDVRINNFLNIVQTVTCVVTGE